MSDGSGVPEYTRQNLRKATKFVEGDYSGINPRSFYRKLKRSIEEIQDGNGFKYTTEGTQERDLSISSEDVGQKTGTVKGRLTAVSDWVQVGDGVLEYRPYGPHGAVGLVVGVIFLLLGLTSGSIFITLLGVVISGAGGYGYMQTEQSEFPITQQDIIRVLITGEVSERTTEGESQTRTDIHANMSVVFAGDVFVAVETTGLEQADWTLRRELVKQVRRWHNQVVSDEREEIPVEDGFMWQLKGWTDRDVQTHRGQIEGPQQNLMSDSTPFSYRTAYTELLEEQLTQEMRDSIQTHEQELMAELEDLAEDVDVYVEREGLQRTQRLEGGQEENKQLDSGSTEDTY